MTYKDAAKRRGAVKIKKTYYVGESTHIALSDFNVGDSAVICSFADSGDGFHNSQAFYRLCLDNSGFNRRFGEFYYIVCRIYAA